MRRMFPGYKFRPNRYNYRYRHFKKTLGIILGVIGLVIIMLVVPLGFWLFLLGLLFISLGISFIKMF